MSAPRVTTDTPVSLAMDLPPRELLALWSELVAAYYGANGYGGDTAELYAYRFMRFLPTVVARAGDMALHDCADYREASERAAELLYQLCARFADEMACGIEVDGRPLGRWLALRPFDHRAHVRVVRHA